jgi:hypothetical protein
MKPQTEPTPPGRSSPRLSRRHVAVRLPHLAGWSDIPAWLVSLAFHLLVFLALVLWWQPLPQGTGAAQDRPAGIAVVHEVSEGAEVEILGSEGKQNEESAAGAAEPSEESLADALSSLPLGAELPEGANDGAASGAPSTGGDLGDATLAGNLSGLGGSEAASGTQGGGKAKTSVFGVEGYGDSFVYLFDRSDSMNAGQAGPLRAAKRELMASLESLTSVHQFQIVFYNEAPTPYRSSISRNRGMLFASDAEKRQAMRFVSNVVALGGTEHLDALRLAIAMAPDVIFFLTDADEPVLKADQLADLVDRCQRAGTTIHAIEFGQGSNPRSGRWIEALADRTGGEYRYLDATELTVP